MVGSGANDRNCHIDLDECLNHPDFRADWIQQIITSPDAQYINELPAKWAGDTVNNTMFNYTLAHPTGIKARVLLRRPCKEPDSVTGHEDVYILAIGTGLDGATGRAHGGLSSVLMDHLLGTTAHRDGGAKKFPPATATMTVDYKNPVMTPTVVLARAWSTEISGRKIWLRGCLENESGTPYVTAKALFINPREAAL